MHEDDIVYECPGCDKNPHSILGQFKSPAISSLLSRETSPRDVVDFLIDPLTDEDRSPPSTCAFCWNDLDSEPNFQVGQRCPECGNYPDEVYAALTSPRCANSNCNRDLEDEQRKLDGPVPVCPECGRDPPY
jgi:hypothetical protein